MRKQGGHSCHWLRVPLDRFPEFMQDVQIVRPRLVFVGLRPIGPRHFADIEVAERFVYHRDLLHWQSAQVRNGLYDAII